MNWAHTQIQIRKHIQTCNEISEIICNLRVNIDKGFATNFYFPDCALHKFTSLAFFSVYQRHVLNIFALLWTMLAHLHE